MDFKFKYKGVEYDSADPKFKEMMINDPEMGAEFKRRVLNAYGSLTSKKKSTFMSAVNEGLNKLINQLVGIIKIEKGLSSQPVDGVKEWTKDGNLLTKFTNTNCDVTVNVCFINDRCRERVNSLLGYEVKTVPYTYSDGYKGIAVVLD